VGSIVLVAAVLGVAGIALVAVLGVYLAAWGPARAGLAGFGVAVALLPITAGIAAGSWRLLDTFSGMALSAEGGMAVVLGGCREAALLIQLGCGAAALILGTAAALGWIGRVGSPDLPAASARRLAVLALAALLAPALVGSALEYARRTRAIVIEVVSAKGPTTVAGGEQHEGGAHAAHDADSPGSAAAISRRVAAGLSIGVLGFPYVALVLAGLAGAAAILAWRVRVPFAFAMALSAFMVVLAFLGTAAVFLFGTPGLG
jgi:hypothetical protein